MTVSEENLKAIQEELKWISLREDSTPTSRLMSKGIMGLLVPVGCLVTSGILFTGIYNLAKKDSRKQQKLMRYRVLAQGVTLALAVIGMTQVKFSS